MVAHAYCHLLDQCTTKEPGEAARIQTPRYLGDGLKAVPVEILTVVEGNGAVGATAVIEISDDDAPDGATWRPWGSPISISGSRLVSRDVVGTVTARYMRARAVEISGDGARVTVKLR